MWVNLSLLPLSPSDIAFLDHRLGTGRVLILSRGYGNCRITNCCVPKTCAPWCPQLAGRGDFELG